MHYRLLSQLGTISLLLVAATFEAQWLAVTDVTPAHDAASETAGKASAAFNGNPAIINEAKELLRHRAQLNGD